MAITGLNLEALVRQLAQLDAEGQIDSLLLDWAADCRGLCDDAAQLVTANELLHVRKVANALAQLFGVPAAEANAAVRSVLLRHPRRESALQLIHQYTQDSAAFDKLRIERQKHEGSRMQ